MHKNNMVELKKFKESASITAGSVLDIGSYDLHGYSARDLFAPPEFQYTGCDMAAGPNVDVVIAPQTVRPIGTFDIVLSLNTMEHVYDPFSFFQFAVNNLKKRGFLFIMAPFSCEFHRHPVDCWRYTPDTFRYLCDAHGVELMDSRITAGGGSISGVITDVAWLIKRGRYRSALNVLKKAPTRIRHFDCNMFGIKR